MNQITGLRILCFLSAALTFTACAAAIEEQAVEITGYVAVAPALPTPVDLQDRSFLTGVPCAPPCWYGLTPGISPQDETLQIVPDLSFLDAHSLDKYTLPHTEAGGVYVDVNCAVPTDKLCVEFIFVSLRLSEIVVFPTYDLFLADLIDVHGSPAYVRLFLASERDICEVQFLWPSLQLGAISENILCKDYAEGKPFDSGLAIRYVVYHSQAYFRNIPDLEYHEPWPGFE